ncbi:MAG: glycosyltransferase, partial [Cyclobacteriaceae bacterium]
VVSRLETYKRVDLVVEAFNKLGKELHIVGKGVEEQRLRSMAGQNVIFRQGLSMKELAAEYAGARAFIFPQEEDFGITPLEANASGIPVIAYGKGGVLETMVPLRSDNASEASAIFFDEQTVDSLISGIVNFEKNESVFDRSAIINNADRFSIERFEREIRAVVEN